MYMRKREKERMGEGIREKEREDLHGEHAVDNLDGH